MKGVGEGDLKSTLRVIGHGVEPASQGCWIFILGKVSIYASNVSTLRPARCPVPHQTGNTLHHPFLQPPLRGLRGVTSNMLTSSDVAPGDEQILSGR